MMIRNVTGQLYDQSISRSVMQHNTQMEMNYLTRDWFLIKE